MSHLTDHPDTRQWHDLEDWLCSCDDCMDAEAVDEGIPLDPYAQFAGPAPAPERGADGAA